MLYVIKRFKELWLYKKVAHRYSVFKQDEKGLYLIYSGYDLKDVLEKIDGKEPSNMKNLLESVTEEEEYLSPDTYEDDVTSASTPTSVYVKLHKTELFSRYEEGETLAEFDEVPTLKLVEDKYPELLLV